MLIKSIKFPKTKNKYFRKIDNKKICFFNKSTNKTANIAVLIGRNGSGKTTLLRWLWQYHEWWNKRYSLGGLTEIKHPKTNYTDETSMFVEACRNRIDFCCRFLPYDEIGYVADGGYDDERRKFFINYLHPYNSKTFSSQCGIKTIYVDGYQSTLSDLQKFYKDIDEWDTSKEPKTKEYIVSFFDDVNILNELNAIKCELEKLYFDDHKKKVNAVNEISPILKGNKINVSQLQTDFIKLTTEIEREINLSIIPDEKNKSLVVRMKDEDKSIIYDFNGLSSRYRKKLLIYFKIIKIRLFDKDKRLFLFVDEIENSLYPNQQEEFIIFLIELSKQLNKENIEHQFFIATHSPFILKNFLSNENTVIINVENGENIKNSKNKELLLNDIHPSYDEINYLYYGIIIPSYYLALYEEIKRIIEKNNCASNHNINYCDFDVYLNKNLGIKQDIIFRQSIDKKNEFDKQTKLTRLRHLLAHGGDIKNENGYKFFDNEKDDTSKKWKNTIEFYEKYVNDYERLLKSGIELIRKIILGLENRKCC